MKAIIQNSFGGPEVLELADMPDPQPGPHEVVIEVHAVSVNRTLDLAVRAGTYVRRPKKLPHILGVDPSGIVTAVGSEVRDRKVGDRVFVNLFLPTDDVDNSIVMRELGRVQLLGVDIWGGYAQKVSALACNTYLIPDGLSFEQATVLARHGPTALNLVERRGGIKAGEAMLVMGATGGIGSLAIQIGKMHGATVIAGAGSPDRAKAALELGADHAIDYRGSDLTAEIERLTDGRGIDLMCDNVGDPDLFPKAFAGLALGGRMVTAGAHAGGKVQLDLKRLYLRRIQIIGDGSELPGGIERTFELAAAGKLSANIDRIMPLEEAAEAHRLASSRDGIGKIILKPNHS